MRNTHVHLVKSSTMVRKKCAPECVGILCGPQILQCNKSNGAWVVENKMAQQFRVVVTLLTYIKFKRKEGTHKTLSNVILELNGIVPVEVIGAEDPLGKLTMGIGEYSF